MPHATAWMAPRSPELPLLGSFPLRFFGSVLTEVNLALCCLFAWVLTSLEFALVAPTSFSLLPSVFCVFLSASSRWRLAHLLVV